MLLTRPRRILMTVDAVGGVWRYAMDLALGLAGQGTGTVFLGFGPRPGPAQRGEAEAAGALNWSDLPLDWTAGNAAALRDVPQVIAETASRAGADAIQVNLPSQAAGLVTDLPVVAVSHSCVVSWFRAVRGGDVPPAWAWQRDLTARGLARAEVVLAPSRSHADLLARCYPGLGPVEVVPNAAWDLMPAPSKGNTAYAAARWWDDGKNAAALDAAAGIADWPVLALGGAEGPQGQRVVFRHARHLGQRSHAEVRGIAAKASIFVSPSIYEPFGLAALEAARAGAALVLSDIPTYREIWDGAALFADPQDGAGFGAALNRLAYDADLRARLAGEAGRRAAVSTPARRSRAMLSPYARAAERAGPQPAEAG